MKITKGQQKLLDMLVAHGPRYDFTDLRLVRALVSKGLARYVKGDCIITAAGKRAANPPRPRRPFNQHTSQDTPGFVETFRVCL